MSSTKPGADVPRVGIRRSWFVTEGAPVVNGH